MVKIFFLSILSIIIFKIGSAQDDEFMHPGIRSSQLGKGHLEVELAGFRGNFFNNSSSIHDIGLERQSQNIIGFKPSFLYGLWKWINVGFAYQFMFIEEKLSDSKTSFVSRYTSNSIGPQIRLKVFGDGTKTEIYLLSNFLIALDNYIPSDKITYSNHLIATRRLGYHWIVSAQVSAILFPNYSEQKRPFTSIANLLPGFLIKNDLMAFAILSHESNFGGVDYAENNKYYRLNYSTYIGAGIKYQVFRKTDISGYYLQTLHSKNNTKFNNLSIGLLKRF